MIRQAKGDKDRMVMLPEAVVTTGGVSAVRSPLDTLTAPADA